MKTKRDNPEQAEIVDIFRLVVKRGVSIRRMAIWLGVSDRTLRRWLSEEDYPNPKLIADAIVASMNPVHPTGTSEWSRSAARWSEQNTIPFGGETERLFYGSHYEGNGSE